MGRKEGGKKERRKWRGKKEGKGERKKGWLRVSALRNQERMVHSTCASPRWGGREGGGNLILTDDPTLGCRDEAGLT